MPIVTEKELRDLCFRIFTQLGASPEEAEREATHLVSNNLVGHDSHGVIQIPGYVAQIQKGEIVPGAKVDVVSQTPAAAILDGVRLATVNRELTGQLRKEDGTTIPFRLTLSGPEVTYRFSNPDETLRVELKDSTSTLKQDEGGKSRLVAGSQLTGFAKLVPSQIEFPRQGVQNAELKDQLLALRFPLQTQLYDFNPQGIRVVINADGGEVEIAVFIVERDVETL